MRHRADDRVLPRRVLHTGPEDRGSHTICAVVTAEFLDHQRRIGNDLTTPMPQYGFPGLVPGDRWCVTAFNWAAPTATAGRAGGAGLHQRAVLDIVPLEALREHAVDVPDDPSELSGSAVLTRTMPPSVATYAEPSGPSVTAE